MDRSNMFANQKSVCVNRDETNAEHIYSKQNISSLETARKLLSGNGFKLWTYFAQNQNGYEFALYSRNVIDKCRFGANTFTKVFKELVDLGFLIQDENDHNHYDFYESPKKDSFKTITIHKNVDSLLNSLADSISG